MKFEPTPEELIEAVIHSDNAPSNLNDAKLRVSGSKWNDEHLKALRVIYLDDVDISRLFPTEYLPSESHEGDFTLKLTVWRMLAHSVQCSQVSSNSSRSRPRTT